MITEIANMALGSLLGGIGQNRRNEKQLEQQDKLLGIQSKWNKDMYDYQQQKQIEMANALGSKWQVQQLKDAGLSVGLMSSKGGLQPTLGGGAPSVGSNPAQQQQSFMDMAAQAANIKLMNAQAEKATAEANKTSGVDTEKTTTEIKNLTQGIENMKVKQRLETTIANIADIDEQIKSGTIGDSMSIIKDTARQLNAAAKIAEGDSEVNKATINTRIETARQDLINKTLEAKAIEQGIQVDKATINKMSADISQGWKRLSIEEKNAVTNYLNYTVNQMNAHTNKQNADTNAINANTNIREFLEKVRTNDMIHGDKQDILAFQKFINDVPESDKLTLETLKEIISLGLLKGAGKAAEPIRNEIGFRANR